MASELACLAATTNRLLREEIKTKSVVAAKLGWTIQKLLREQQKRPGSSERRRARRWVRTERKAKSFDVLAHKPLVVKQMSPLKPFLLPYQTVG